jgi:hypothetical protein
MPVDLDSALRATLDVALPPLRFERICERAARHVHARERRHARAMLSAAALVALIALFAGEQAETTFYAPVAAAPAPAPAPLAT